MILTIARRCYHRDSSRGTIYSNGGNRISNVITILAVFAALPGCTVAVAMDQDADLRDVTTSSDVTSHVSYIVTLADGCESPADVCEALAKENGGTVEYVYEETLPGCCLTLPVASQAQEASDEMIASLSDSPEVNYVEEDQLYFAIGEGDIFDHTFDQPMPAYNHEEGNIFDLASEIQTSAPTWGLDRIDQCSLPLDGSFTKQNATGATVFILDTGIRGDHEEFGGMINTTDTCHFSTIITDRDALTDRHGHGTHVAGTTCGRTYGVSSNCRLCSAKVLNATGYGTTGGIIAAMNHVIKVCTNNTASSTCVINMSLGGGFSASLNTAVNKTVAAGIVVVVAAGNGNKTGAVDACETSPASATAAITVGSIANKTDTKSSFSNFGACVDIYAPGERILSASNRTNTSYIMRTGTSMASPHVAGIVVGIRSKNPGLNSTQVVDAIVGSAAQLSSGILLALVDGVSCTRMPSSPPTTRMPRTLSPTSNPTATSESPVLTPKTLSPTSPTSTTTLNPTAHPSSTPTTIIPTSTPAALPVHTPTTAPTKEGRPSSTPTTKVPPYPGGIIFMTISANISVSNVTVANVTVAGQGRRIRRQLVVTNNDISTIMSKTIQDVVKSSLNANQSLLVVNITAIKSFFVNGSLAGTTVDSEFLLTEQCTGPCEDQLQMTTMNTTVISALTLSIDNDTFMENFIDNAKDQCATNCSEIKYGTVTGRVFNETKRGEIEIRSGPPTGTPSAKPTLPPSTPTTMIPTSTLTKTPARKGTRGKSIKSKSMKKNKPKTQSSILDVEDVKDDRSNIKSLLE